MVYFTCNHCGESVKKPSVEKHYMTKCRGKPKSVSCMDCQKDFYVEDYVAHISCITEAEKYSGKNYVPKESKFVGKKKQENWSETIRSILDKNKYPLSQRELSIFKRLQQHENVPRKKEKFQNFIVNCLKVNINDAKSIWNILEMELQKLYQSKAQDKTANDKKISTPINANKQETSAKPNNDSEVKSMEEIRQSKVQDKPADDRNHSITVNAKVKKSGAKTNNNSEAKTKEKKLITKDHEPSTKKFKREVDQDKDKENCAKDNSQGITNGNVIANDGSEANELSITLEKIVTKHNEGITIDKLKKKFLKKYKSKLQLDELTEKQDKKFQKKFWKLLNASAIIQLDGDIVKAG